MAGVAKRKDPRPRPVEHGAGRTGIRNRNPEFHYVLVHNAQVGEYDFMGYAPVHAEPGGERLNGVNTRDGEIIQHQDGILMRIPLKSKDPEQPSKESIDKFGPDGESGWALTEAIENRIIDKRSAQTDAMRGIKGAYGYVGVESNIQPLRPDYGGANVGVE